MMGCRRRNCMRVDLHAEFLDLGYDLFLDRDTLKATMFAADVFQPMALWAN